MTPLPFRPAWLLPALAAGVIALGAAGAARAASQEDQADAIALAAAKITLTQAIATAEHAAGGRAIGADVETTQGQPHFAIEVAAGQSVRTVLVDPATGRVIATHATGAEQEQNGEHED